MIWHWKRGSEGFHFGSANRVMRLGGQVFVRESSWRQQRWTFRQDGQILLRWSDSSFPNLRRLKDRWMLEWMSRKQLRSLIEEGLKHQDHRGHGERLRNWEEETGRRVQSGHDVLVRKAEVWFPRVTAGC